MSPSRRPRRSFAAPFVVTLAAMPACVVTSEPPAKGPAGGPVAQTTPDPAPQPQPDPHTVPTRPDPQPQPQPRPEPQPEAKPPIIVSNPPRPQPAPQPPAEPPRPEPPKPEPVPQPQPADGRKWTVHVQPDGSCRAALDVNCNPKATCNPPPPFKMDACPPYAAVNRPVTIIQLRGECQVQPPPVECKKGMTCNPPPPRKVACPGDAVVK